MAKLRINGDSSGYVDLEAPNAASSSTLDLDQVPQKNAANTFTTGQNITFSPGPRRAQASRRGRPMPPRAARRARPRATCSLRLGTAPAPRPRPPAPRAARREKHNNENNDSSMVTNSIFKCPY